MKTDTFRSVTLHSIVITIFFAGVILSGGALYLMAQHFWKDALEPVSILIAATFLAGIISISLISRATKRDVIYLEKQKEVRSDGLSTGKVVTRIDQSELEGLIHDEQAWLSRICDQIEAAQGALYLLEEDGYQLKHGYALIRDPKAQIRFASGEGIIGRVAAECKALRIDELPEGYMTVVSGLGQSSPRNLMAFPVHRNDKCYGVLELASFSSFNEGLVNEIQIAIDVFAGNQILN